MSDHVYKSLELTGSSKVGIEEAVNNAIAKASETVRTSSGSTWSRPAATWWTARWRTGR